MDLAETVDKPLKCYTAAFHNREIDPYLNKMGFAHGVTAFSVPALGILFRCRAHGSPIDLEFAALLGVLRLLKKRLSGVNIRAITILSSNPQFVFSFASDSRKLLADSGRGQMLREFCQRYQLSITYVDPRGNKALMNAAEYASICNGPAVKLTPDPDDQTTARFVPFQKGLVL